MTSTPLEVQVIYSAGSRGRKRRGRVVHTRRVGGFGLVLLGLLNLAAAGGLYYWTWWKVDKEIYLKLMMYTPIKGLDANVSSGFLVPKGTKGKATGNTPVKVPATRAVKAPAPAAAESVAARYQGDTAQVVMGATSYSWLALASVAMCSLAASAGAAFGRRGGSRWRLVAGLLALGFAAGLGWLGYQTWMEYGGAYPPRYFRFGMGAVVGIALLLGMGIVRRVRRWTLLAGLAIILSAAGSVVAIYLGQQCGAYTAAYVTPKFLGTVFGIQSAWGWVLLPVAWRMSRD